MRAWLVGSLARASDQVAGSSPAIWAGLGPAPQKNSSKIISKNLWFSANILLHFNQYWFVFLYCKDTNLVLKYLVFVKTKKKYFVFMHTAKSLKKNIVFSNNKISKKKSFSMHFGFNNQFIKVTRTSQYFKNSKKIILFSFNKWGYDLIRKIYSEY
jgi:hypothetical protein